MQHTNVIRTCLSLNVAHFEVGNSPDDVDADVEEGHEETKTYEETELDGVDECSARRS